MKSKVLIWIFLFGKWFKKKLAKVSCLLEAFTNYNTEYSSLQIRKSNTGIEPHMQLNFIFWIILLNKETGKI